MVAPAGADHCSDALAQDGVELGFLDRDGQRYPIDFNWPSGIIVSDEQIIAYVRDRYDGVSLSGRTEFDNFNYQILKTDWLHDEEPSVNIFFFHSCL